MAQLKSTNSDIKSGKTKINISRSTIKKTMDPSNLVTTSFLPGQRKK